MSSVLERVGDKGSVTHIYQTGQPQTNCLAAMDYTPEGDGRPRCDQHPAPEVTRVGSGHPRQANHPRPEAADTGEPPNKKLATETGVEASNGGRSDKPMRMSLREKSVATDNKLTLQRTNVTASLLSS